MELRLKKALNVFSLTVLPLDLVSNKNLVRYPKSRFSDWPESLDKKAQKKAPVVADARLMRIWQYLFWFFFAEVRIADVCCVFASTTRDDIAFLYKHRQSHLHR